VAIVRDVAARIVERYSDLGSSGFCCLPLEQPILSAAHDDQLKSRSPERQLASQRSVGRQRNNSLAAG
jgi:hypothetical protein